MISRAFFFFTIFSFLFFTSCTNDDLIEPETYSGIWHLKTYDDPIDQNDVNYMRSDVIWNFNEDTNRLTIEFDFSASTLENYETLPVGINSGIYDYSIIQENGMDYLMVNDLQFGEILLSTNVLTLNRTQNPNQSMDNLFTWVFER